MSNGKAKLNKTQADNIVKLKREQKKQQGLNRRNSTGMGSTITASGNNVFSNNLPTNNFLSTSGGTMIGPLAIYRTNNLSLYPKSGSPPTGNNNTLDISKGTEGYSSYIYWVDAGSRTLDTISGAEFSGQILCIQNIDTTATTNNTFVIRDVSSSSSNIKTLDGNSVTLGPRPQVIMFIYSDITGKWQQISNPQVSSGSSWVGTATSDLDMGTYDINNVVDIGTALNPVDNIYIERLRFETGTGVSNIPNIYSANGNDIDFNVTSSLYKFSFRFGGTTRFEVDNNSITVVNTAIIGDGTSGNGAVVLNDSTSMVGAANGYVYREGSDVKIYTGGSEKNISNMLASNQSVTITGGWTFNSILNVYPALDSTYDLGSSTVRFDEIYADDIISGSIGEGANFGCVISFSSTGINLITNSNDRVSISPGGTSDFDFENGQLNLNSSTVINHTATTTAPTTAGTYNQYIVSPIGYISIKVNGISYKVPYYT